MVSNERAKNNANATMRETKVTVFCRLNPELFQQNFFHQVFHKILAHVANDKQRIVRLPCKDIAANMTEQIQLT